MKIKVLYDHDIFLRQYHGGISTFFDNLIQNLNENNFDIKNSNFFYKNNKIRNQSNTFKKLLHGSRFFRLKHLVNEFVLYRDIKIFRPDIVHFTYYKKSIKKEKNIKYIISCFDLIEEKDINNSVQNKKNFFLKQNSFNLCDHIICISDATKADLIEIYKINEKKISVIHLGGNHLLNIKKNSEFKKKNYILHVGNRHGYKNFKLLLNVFIKNKTINKNFSLITFGGEELSNEEQTIFNKFNNNSVETKIERINGDDSLLKSLYFNASLFVNPSLNEGFGITNLEALNLKAKIIVSKIDVFEEILKSSEIYFNPYKEKELLDLLKKILIEKKNNYGNVRKDIFGKFTWLKTAIEMEKVYKNIL